MPLARPHASRRTGTAVIAAAFVSAAALTATGAVHDAPVRLDAAAAPRLDVESSVNASSAAAAPLRAVPARADRRARVAVTGSAASLPSTDVTAGQLPDLTPPAIAEPAPADAPGVVDPAPPPAPGPTWVRPGDGRFSSGFAKRWGRMHKGIDLAAPIGAPIYAAADGTVSFAGPASGFGRLVKVRHADGIETWYGHMSKILVKEGEKVKAGDLIAKVGREGKSTGPHLHFEVHVGGDAVDPVPFLKARGVRI